MSKKSTTSTQQVEIPQDVLNRYNSINQTAQTAADRPFQTYSNDPSAFVAPMTETQQQGVSGTNAYANSAQPYYGAATGQLLGAQAGAYPYYGQATADLAGAQGVGQGLGAATLGAITNAQNQASPYYYGAGQNIAGAQNAGNYYTGQAGQTLAGGQGASQPYYGAATQSLLGGMNTGAELAGQSYGALTGAQTGANSLQGQGAQNYQQAANYGNTLAGLSMGTLAGAQSASNPLYGQALQTVQGGQSASNALTMGALDSFAAGQAGAQPFYDKINLTGGGDGGGINTLNAGLAGAKPWQDAAGQSYTDAYGAAQPFNTAAGNLYSGGLSAAQPYNTQGAASYQSAVNSANPLNQAAGQNYTGALAAANPLNQAANQNISGAQSGAQGYQQAATGLAAAGTQAVDPSQLNIQQYMSPYIQSVLNGTAGMLNQQNQQAMAGQTGNAIRSGAFGGDRAGIAAANLQQQQRVADAGIFSGILNQGFNTALGTAQQQQGVELGASQANRAALQQGAGQMAAIGQQGFNQNLSTAQAQQALAQQMYGQQTGTGQAQAALGQQQYAQGMGLGQAQTALGQQIFGQQQTAGQNQQSLGQQNYAQGMGLGQAQQGLGQQTFEQARGAGELQANIANMGFQQSLGAANLNANLAQQKFSQGLAGAQLAQGLGAQLYGQGLSTAQLQQGVGSQLFGQGLSTSQQQANVGQQQYAQGMGLGQAQTALGQQVYGQGLGASQQLGALGQQQYAQGAGASAALQGLGQTQYNQALSGSQQEAALGNQAYTQGMGVAGAQQGLGQAVYGTGAQTANTLGALGQQMYGQGLSTSQQNAALGQGLYGMGAGTSSALAGLGTASQAAGLQGAQAQLGAGQVEQQTQQAGLQALYNQFLQQQSYPFQTAQFLANVGLGTGAQSGSTTTTTQPGGFFSDKRLKENAEPIGKTFDGQNIYKFNYKGGDKRTTMGLMAQDVEKRHPDAVGEASGYKTVDYDKATAGAAKRGKFYQGGLVANDDAPMGYAEGGVAGFDPAIMAQLLQNSAGMYGPYMTAAGGSPYGGSGRVPAANLPVGQMMTAGPLPEQETTAERMGKIAALADSKGAAKAIEWGKKKWESRKEGGAYEGNEDIYARGGLVGYAAGGMPYSEAAPTGLVIPDQQPGGKKMADPGALPEHESDFDKIKDIAKIAAMFIPAANGGRIQKAGGGITSLIGQDYDPDEINRQRALARAVGQDDKPWYRRPIQDLAADAIGSYGADQAKRRAAMPAGVSSAIGQDYDPRQIDKARSATRASLDARARDAALSAAQNWKAPVDNPRLMGAVEGAPSAPGVQAVRPQSPINWGDAPARAPQPQRSNRPSAVAVRAGLNPSAPPSVGAPPPAPMNGAPQMPPMPTANMAPQVPAEPVSAPLGAPEEYNPSIGQRFGASEVGQGLGAGVGALKNVGKKIANSGYIKDVREGKPEAVLSLLSAISAMGTAPTRSLGVAAAAGLGAGAQTYAGTQKRLADIASTKATTAQTEAATAKEITGLPAKPGYVAVEDETGASPLVVSGKHYKYVPIGSVMGRGAPGASASETPVKYSYLGGSGKEAAPQSYDTYMMADPATQSAMRAQQSEIANAGAQAQAGMTDTQTFANSLSANKDGLLAPGALNPFLSNAVSYWNAFADKLPPGAREAAHIDGLDANQIANKMSTNQAAMRSVGADQNSLGAMMAFAKAVPGTAQQRDAALHLMAAQMINGQRAIDLANYQNEFDKEIVRNGGVANNFSPRDVQRAFANDISTPAYNRDMEAIQRLLTNGVFSKLTQRLADADEDGRAALISGIDKEWGDRFHRYFTGGE